MPEHTHPMVRAALAALATAGTLALTVLTPASTALAGDIAPAAGPALAGSNALADGTVLADGIVLADSAPSGVSAPEAAIADARTGTLLWSRELNTQRPIASITKVMTALVVLRSGGLNRTITIPQAVVTYVNEYGASSAGLHPGDRLTVGQLLNAMLLPSGADAAYALASAYGPGIGAFVAKMNATARLMGMSRTHFTNFDGLPYPYHNADYSTAADLIKLGRAAMAWPAFRTVVAARRYHLSAGSGHRAYTWYNTNPLLGHYPGAIGIKTGWTPYSGHCLLFEVRLGGITLIGVNLDSPGQGSTVNGTDATRILNWAFAQHAR
jgi:D-alanyl-D-alanine carboxypeptidase (penicillin-binding protein 5/6)